MRYVFIEAEKAFYPVEIVCRVMRVSRSGYYAWKQRVPSKREREDNRLRKRISVIHSESRQTYGSPRIFKALRNDGERIGLHRVERLCKMEGVMSCYKRRYRTTTQSKHWNAVAPNILDRKFRPAGPNQVWAGDITYIATAEGWLYLAVIIDLYSRLVIGWSIGNRLNSELSEKALVMSLQRRQLAGKLLHHSDRGVQYASAGYQALLGQHQIICSMSRKGDCWDNAVVESFFKTLKVECVYRQRFCSREEARQKIFEYIEIFYNRQRLHSTLDYQSPADYEYAQLAA